MTSCRRDGRARRGRNVSRATDTNWRHNATRDRDREPQAARLESVFSRAASDVSLTVPRQQVLCAILEAHLPALPSDHRIMPKRREQEDSEEEEEEEYEVGECSAS